MAKSDRNRRPRFEESDFEDAGEYPQFLYRAGVPNLPPVEFKVEEIEDSASPEEMIRAAMEDRVVETSLNDDAAFGPVVVPLENSLYGYKYALSHSGHNIRFSAQTYAIFDGIIVRECGVDASGNATHAAFNPRFEDYSFYAPLRRNIAILRNYLMGVFPPKEKINQATLKALAERLGKALAGEAQKLTLIQRILWAIRRMLKGSSQPELNRFLALANTPDRGIAFMYQYLCEQQALASFAAMLPSTQLPKDWKLLPLEQTAFSGSNMARFSDATRMSQIATALDFVTRRLGSVDDMTPKDKEISVDHARDILKNLRIIMTGQIEEKVYDEMDPRCREAQTMLNSALGFQGALAELARNDPDALNDPLVMDASKSILKLANRVRSEEKTMMKQENRVETTTQPQTQQQPKTGRSKSAPAKQKSGDTANKLMFKFEEGATRLGERRRASRDKQRTNFSQAIGTQVKLQKNLSDGMSTISGPKIHQVSLRDTEFVEQVKKLNEQQAEESQKIGHVKQTQTSK